MPSVQSNTIRFFRCYQLPPEVFVESSSVRVVVVVVVVVFFTLTDRASTILVPSNTRGCQSGTWSAGQEKIRGTSTKLQ